MVFLTMPQKKAAKAAFSSCMDGCNFIIFSATASICHMGVGSSSTNPNPNVFFYPSGVNFLRAMNEIGVGIYLLHSANNTFPFELFLRQ